MNTEQLITEYENFKNLTKGFLLQQEQTDHERIAQKIHQWATQGENKTTITQQEIEQYLNTHSIGTKPTQW